VTKRTEALDATVYGVDVQSGDVRGDAPTFALAVYDGGEVARERVSYHKLLRRIQSTAPDLVATDNVYELAADKDDLVRFLERLPPETTLVQVTGDERPEPLSRVADRHGVAYAQDPMAEAEAAARLAARNVGSAVRAFADRTTVKVSRGRSIGKGGSSEDRYTRRIHGNVKTEARRVESALDEAGLSYDRDVTEKYGGFSNAVFSVEAPVGEIPVSAGRSGDTRIEIEPVKRDGIDFEPLVTRRDRVFVGVDPGTTTAVGVVDLDGEVLETWNSRTADMAETVEWIIDRGRPVLVAADVTPMPETVERIRRSFDAAGWTPAADLPVDEKLHRTREHPTDNDHERDALAAALFARDDHVDTIDRVIEKVPPTADREAVVETVIAEATSVEAALKAQSSSGTEQEDPEEPEPDEPNPEKRRIRDLESQVDRLQDHVEDLKGRLDEKEATIEDLQERLSAAKREERTEARSRREVSKLQWENDRLEAELEEERRAREDLEGKLERLKALWKLDHSNFEDVDREGNLTPVKVIEKFTVEAIESAHEAYGIADGDVVYFRDASGAGRRTAETLIDHEPRLVLRNGGISDVADRLLFEHDVPVAPAEQVTIQEVDELAVARETDVEAAIADWERRAEQRLRERNAEMVDELISEHRAERRDADPSELLDS
jgi:predicted RNase H-like nuclease (RuvC/YqgF family)